MELPPLIDTVALGAALALALAWFALRARRRGSRRARGRQGSRAAASEALDTLAAWPPEAARVLAIDERQAYELLRRAAPSLLVLAQVPLARFLRVPMRHSYAEWLQRVGSLSADLVVCDSGSRVLAVVDIRASDESARSRRRHERMTRVLEAAGIQVLTWREGELPSASTVRSVLAPLLLRERAPAARPTGSGSMPLIPVPEMEEILAEGDRLAASGDALEPVPSGFLDEAEAAAPGRH